MNVACRLLITVLATLVPMAASAQTRTTSPTAEVRVAFFSPERVFAESADGRAATARINALRDEKARAIEARNKELSGKEQALKTNSASLTERTRRQQTAEVEKFRLDTQRFVEDAQAELMGVERDVESAFLAKLRPAVDKVVAAKGFPLLLSADTPLIVWFDPADDITADIVKQLASTTSKQ